MSGGKRRGHTLIVGGIIFLSAFTAIVYLGLTSAPSGHEGLAVHWHVKLTISDLRKPLGSDNLTIPGNIGVPGGLWRNHTLDRYGGVFAPLHTHDETGTIHVEPKILPPTLFTLKDFFNIWGVPFDGGCVWDYCASAQAGLAPPIMATKRSNWLEGCVDPGYGLRDGDQILILIGANFIPGKCGTSSS